MNQQELVNIILNKQRIIEKYQRLLKAKKILNSVEKPHTF